MSDEALNVEIARLVWPKMRLFYEDWDTDKLHPMCIPSGKPLRTHKIDARPIPRYDVDPGAALGLLEYVLRQRRKRPSVSQLLYEDTPLVVTDITISEDGVYVEICSFFDPEYMLAQFTGEADTLPAAIARACRDALAALREAKP